VSSNAATLSLISGATTASPVVASWIGRSGRLQDHNYLRPAPVSTGPGRTIDRLTDDGVLRYLRANPGEFSYWVPVIPYPPVRIAGAERNCEWPSRRWGGAR